MSEKKIFKMDDEAMQNVTGGQEYNGPSYEDASSGYDADFDVNKNYEDHNTVTLTCPECGGDLGKFLKGTTFGGVCHHCNKTFTVTV